MTAALLRAFERVPTADVIYGGFFAACLVVLVMAAMVAAGRADDAAAELRRRRARWARADEANRPHAETRRPAVHRTTRP